MRLLSLEAKQYRGHRELKIDFDPSLTLIGGPNESGKSTLVEALHRGLFLKGTTTGQYLQEMQSRSAEGTPQVMIEFESRGRRYRVTKRFAGARGATLLEQERGSVWKGEEAEEKLAGILGVEAPGKGSAATKRALQHWAHLWAWQGYAGSDPTEFATSQRESLLTRLQRNSGRSILLSDRDARIAEVVAERVKELVGSRGDWLAGSRPGLGRSALERLETEWLTAKQSVDRLAQQIDEFERARRLLQDLVPRKEAEAAKLIELEQRWNQVSEIKAELERATAERDRSEAALTQWNKVIATAEQLNQELEQRRQAATPLDSRFALLELERQTAQQQVERLDRQVREAENAVRQSFERLELNRLRQVAWEAREAWDRETKRHGEVLESREQLANLDLELRKLPELSDGELEQFRQLAQDLAGSEAAVEAMAAEISVMQASLPIEIDHQSMGPGESRIVVGESEIQIGTQVRLRIRPGGGMGLREALRKRDDIKQTLQTRLEWIGVSSLMQAIQLRQSRSSLEATRQSLISRLEALQSASSEELLRGAESKRLASEAELQLRLKQHASAVAETSDLIEDRETLALRHRQVEVQEQETRRELDAATAMLRRIEQDREQLLIERRQLQLRIEELATRLAQWSETYGDVSVRESELKQRQMVRDHSIEVWESTQSRLLELDSATIDSDRSRLQRVLRGLDAEIAEARNTEIRQTALLTSLGDTDPIAHLRSIEAQRDEARRDFEGAERKARGTLLLQKTLQEARRELTDRLIGPFTDRIDHYLKTLFDRDCSVELSFVNDQFEGLQLYRNSRELSAFDFHQLSAGTREQLAAAFRFAMAEVLATDFDGTLPLVFDDAFVNSDPERLERLQRMLDVAASRRLQVIILSCTPHDYVGLGAKTIRLSPLSATHGDAKPEQSLHEESADPRESSLEA